MEPILIALTPDELTFLVDQLFTRKVILNKEGMHIEASEIESLLSKLDADNYS